MTPGSKLNKTPEISGLTSEKEAAVITLSKEFASKLELISINSSLFLILGIIGNSSSSIP